MDLIALGAKDAGDQMRQRMAAILAADQLSDLLEEAASSSRKAPSGA
jgi:hypothetical protein